MASSIFENIRVLFKETWGNEREVLWRMQWRGTQLYLYNRRTLTKVLSSEQADQFFAGAEFPHGGRRTVKFLGRVAEG